MKKPIKGRPDSGAGKKLPNGTVKPQIRIGKHTGIRGSTEKRPDTGSTTKRVKEE